MFGKIYEKLTVPTASGRRLVNHIGLLLGVFFFLAGFSPAPADPDRQGGAAQPWTGENGRDWFLNGTGPGSLHYWLNGRTHGSAFHWEFGTNHPSRYYWVYGDAPGSARYWYTGEGKGTRTYWRNGDAAPSARHWEEGTGAFSRAGWEQGEDTAFGPVFAALCLGGAIHVGPCTLMRELAVQHETLGADYRAWLESQGLCREAEIAPLCATNTAENSAP